MPETLEGEAIQQIVGLTRKNAQPLVSEAIHAVVVPNDCKLESLEKFQYPHGLPPSRIRQTVKLRDAKSFCSYFSSYADDRARIFADPTAFNFLAVFDYHGAGERKPEFLDHRATFQMVHDERWKIWTAANEKPMDQAAFGEFIEDNRRDIATPEPATMLEVARNLTAKTEVNFASSTRASNGQVQLRYEETVKAGVPTAGNMEVPEEFVIRVPVFYGEQPVSIAARLRFRITGGKLTFFYKLYRPVEVVNDAFNGAVASISEALTREVLIGGL